MSLLEVWDLSLGYGGVRAVDGLDLTLGAGEILALIGPNGCGKTSLFDLLTGVRRPDRGTIRFAGQRIERLPPHRRAALGIGRKFQVPDLFGALAIEENMQIALTAGHASGTRPVEALAAFGFHDRLERTAAELAHGERQRLELAMVLATVPRLVLLDEPTAGLGPGETAWTVRKIEEVAATSGAAVIVIEHDLAFVRDLGAPVGFMLRGRIERRGTYAEIAADPLVRRTYLGGRG